MTHAVAQPIWVEAWRGDHVESRHEIRWARMPAGFAPGDDSCTTFLRSAAKPFQLLAFLLAADSIPFEAADLAVMAGSHDGTDAHASRVAGILQRLGMEESDLRCGVHRPYFLESLPARSPERLRTFGPLHNNCSGNHAAMLGLARLHGLGAEQYLDPQSPSQKAIHAVVGALCGEMPALAEDSCAAPCYALPLARMAEGYAFLAHPAGILALPLERRRALERVASLDAMIDALTRIADAMARQPEWVTGEGSGYTCVVRALGGEAVLKHGAEGVLCVAHRSKREGWALKVMDGNERALVPALLHLAAGEGWLDPTSRAALSEWFAPPLLGRVDQVVGRLRIAPDRTSR